jgi:hypothetical protein
MLDALIQSLTILFVLSLGVERVTALFKRHDWQPLQRWSGSTPQGLRVALDTKSVTHDGLPVVDPEARDRAVRNTTAANTLFVGVLLAFATRANAFSHLIPLESAPALTVRSPDALLYWASWTLQVAMTGAAAGIGSSFWYDLLSLLIEIRRTRSAVAQATKESPAAPAQVGPQGAPAAQPVNLQRTATAASDFRTAAEQAVQAAALKVTGRSKVRVLDAPGVPGLECLVEVDDPLVVSKLPEKVPVKAGSGDVMVPVIVLLRRAA